MNSFFFWQEYATEESQQYKVFAIITDNMLSVQYRPVLFDNDSNFVTSASCIPDTLMHPIGHKDQSIDLNMHVCYKNIQPVRVVSVAVIWLLFNDAYFF